MQEKTTNIYSSKHYVISYVAGFENGILAIVRLTWVGANPLHQPRRIANVLLSTFTITEVGRASAWIHRLLETKSSPRSNKLVLTEGGKCRGLKTTVGRQNGGILVAEEGSV